MWIWKNYLCIFEKSCNWVAILTTCSYRQSCTQFKYWSQQDLHIPVNLRFTHCNQIKSDRLAQKCHQEQPWEQLSLERKFTVKAVLLFVGIYISNQKSKRILACVGCLQAGECRMGTCCTKQILNSPKNILVGQKAETCALILGIIALPGQYSIGSCPNWTFLSLIWHLFIIILHRICHAE